MKIKSFFNFWLIAPLIFFIFGVATLPSYGINWDTINHLPRGQAYLNYFLTGKKDYSNLQPFFNGWQAKDQWYWQDPSSLAIKTNIPLKNVPRRSLYQNDEVNFNYFMQYDGYGHPPLSDIFSSVFNLVLFQKLGIINDIDSYHVYGIFLAALSVGLIFYWVSKNYGKLAGLISALVFSTYPLFWSESHFNTEKDIPEAAYWLFFLYFLWKGITEKKFRWVLLSGVLFGLALGTKFNILFAVFVIVPWFAFYLYGKKEFLFSRFNIKLFFAGVIAMGTGVFIFVASWPYLWPDPIARFSSVIQFYRDIGVATGAADLRFLGPLGTNTYPIIWIVVTTPPAVLFLAGIGIFVAIKNIRKENNKLSLLFLLALIIPIARVTWHGANIYGGIRQIMEYIPALAVMAGIGASALLNFKFKILKTNFSKILFTLVIFMFLIVPIAETHPNENVYFNFLIGGLAGAKKENIPAWGNSFGSAYRQAVVWIDNNLPQKANLTFAYELIPNIPRIWIRTDINLTALNRSGYLRKGEYAITLTYQGTDTRSYYDMYLNTFMNPVYTSKVDGVPVVTIWKNDEAHLKKPWVEKQVPNVLVNKTMNGLKFDLNGEYKISRLDMTYDQKNCTKLNVGYFEVSGDGNTWVRLSGVLPDDWSIATFGEQPKNGSFVQPFAGQNVRYVNFYMSPVDTCLLKNYSSVKFYYLQ